MSFEGIPSKVDQPKVHKDPSQHFFAGQAKSIPQTSHAPHTKAKADGFTPAGKHAPDALKNIGKANREYGQKLNHNIKEPIQAVQDYLGAARDAQCQGNSEWAHRSLNNAGVQMKKLEDISRDPKLKPALNKHDRAAIAATRKIYENHRKANWGEKKDLPEVALLKMSHERHFPRSPMTRQPENYSQVATLTRTPDSQPIPKRLEVARPGHEPKTPHRLTVADVKHAPRPKTPREMPRIAAKQAPHPKHIRNLTPGSKQIIMPRGMTKLEKHG